MVRFTFRATGDISRAWGLEGVGGAIEVTFNNGNIIGVSWESNFPAYTDDYWPRLEANHESEWTADCPVVDQDHSVCTETILLYMPEFMASDEYTGP